MPDTPPPPTARPSTAARLTKAEFDVQLLERGERPVEVWSGEAGTKVMGPCHRTRLDDAGYVCHVRRYYRITYPTRRGCRAGGSQRRAPRSRR